jgi:hypothetical protein
MEGERYWREEVLSSDLKRDDVGKRIRRINEGFRQGPLWNP